MHEGISDEDTAESLLWYTNHKPLEKFNSFHAPLWTWASLDGIISFDMLPPIGAISMSLVEELKFNVKPTCGINNSNDRCKGTCVSGQVCFNCPVGNICRSTRLENARLIGPPDDPISKEALRLLLGSAVDFLGPTIPRYDVDGHLVPSSGQTFVPGHTELLVDEDVYVGFFIPDMERESGDEINVVCASITVWRARRDKFRENDTIEVIGIQATDQSNTVFHRVGRGRIICNAWLPGCEKRDITIV